MAGTCCGARTRRTMKRRQTNCLRRRHGAGIPLELKWRTCKRRFPRISWTRCLVWSPCRLICGRSSRILIRSCWSETRVWSGRLRHDSRGSRGRKVGGKVEGQMKREIEEWGKKNVYINQDESRSWSGNGKDMWGLRRNKKINEDYLFIIISLILFSLQLSGCGCWFAEFILTHTFSVVSVLCVWLSF